MTERSLLSNFWLTLCYCRNTEPCGSGFIRDALLQGINLYRMYRPLANEFVPTEGLPVSWNTAVRHD